MKNLFKSKKFKMMTTLSILLFIYISICAFSYAQSVSTDISNSVFRLHVIANSDTKEDQDLKYKVRDNLLKFMNNICKNCNTKEEAITIAKEHKNDFENIALQTIKENGYDYNVKINIGNFEFPTKQYGDVSLPAGFYDALRVEIGKAQGQNWWCVMFPPLCFVDVTSGVVPEESKEQLENNLSEEEFALVSDKNTPTIKFKFKILELFNNSDIATAKK